MPTVEKHAPGFFCWIELSTTDAAAAKAFYGALFGWQPNDLPMGPDAFYTMLMLDGKEVGALYGQSKEQREQHIPPHWLQYVAVASVDDSAARAKSLGGKVLAEPLDVFDAGRMAVVQDPTGGTLALWQANKSVGARIVGELHTMAWNELATSDKAKAQEFYVKLFSWELKNEDPGPMHYTEIHHQGQAIGGMLQLDPNWGKIPSNWMIYCPVANCDASVAKVRSLGGSVMMPPKDIEKVGRFAVLSDPQGAVFAIIQMTGPM